MLFNNKSIIMLISRFVTSAIGLAIICSFTSCSVKADVFPIVENNLPATVDKIEFEGRDGREPVRGVSFVQTFIKRADIWVRDDSFDFETIWLQAKAGKYANCDIEANTLSKGIVHKGNLEVFVAPMRKTSNGPINLRIIPSLGESTDTIPLTQKDNCLVRENDVLQPVTHGLPAQELQFELLQGDAKLLEFKVPEKQLAYLLIRYQVGDLLPVPFFIDTAVFDTDEDGNYSKVHLIFRAQFPTIPEVRKVDVLSFYPEQFDLQKVSSAERESNELRLNATKRFFMSCPYHEEQLYSVCASHTEINLLRRVDEDYLTLLGIKRQK